MSECWAEISTLPSRPDQVHIAVPGTDRDRHFTRQGNVEIGFDRMIARGFGLGVERDQAADGGNRGLGFAVVFVGVALAFAAHALADHHGDLVVVGGVHADCPVRVDDLQAGSGGEGLFEMIVKVVALPEKMWRSRRCRRR